MSDETQTNTNSENSELAKVIRKALTHLEESAWWSDDLGWISMTKDVEQALSDFTSAARLAPDEPWIWFQIGWCNLTLEETESARTALERVLALDAKNVCAHLALAYLEPEPYLEPQPSSYPFDDEYTPMQRASIMEVMYYALADFDSLADLDPEAYLLFSQAIEHAAKNTLMELADSQEYKQRLEEYRARREEYSARKMEADWPGPRGTHLRAALEAGGPARALYTRAHIAEESFNYYYTEAELDRFLEHLETLGEHLETLGEIVPEDLRANYYNGVGIALADAWGWSMGQAQKWFERAIRWEAGDPEALFYAHIHFSEGFYDMEPPDYLAACQALSKAYSYLMETQDPVDGYVSWLMGVKHLAEKWEPGDDLAELLSLCNAALDLRPFGERLPKHVSGADIAPIAEAAGILLVERGDLARAERYFLRAKDLDPTRVSVARRLSELYVDRQQWSKALTEQQRAARLAPADPDAQRLVVVLAVAATAAKSGLQPELDAIRSGIAGLQAGQDLMISLQRDLLQKVSDEQRRAQLMLKRPLDSIAEERVYADLLDQLHNLVQQGSRVQMDAVRVARDRLVEILGNEYFSALSRDCQHFLITAETFYIASTDVPEEVDAALIAVEYAKVVETELRHRFLRKLGSCLDESGYRGHPGRRGRLLCESTGVAREKEDSWEDTFALLTLGSIVRLLRATICPARNPTVADCVRKLGVKAEGIELLVEDVETIRTKYRNGAAHTQRLDRADLDEFRDLLFEKELLRRLVVLGKRVDAPDAS